MSVMYTIMSYGGLALSVICLVIVIILFVKWDIPKVLGELTGSAQKKAIEKIRTEGYQSDASKRTSIPSGSPSGTIRAHKTNTDELTDNDTGTTAKLSEPYLSGEEETSVLGFEHEAEEEDTTVLSSADEAEVKTTVLSETDEAEAETTVLSGTDEAEAETTVLSATAIESHTDMTPSTTVLTAEDVEEAIQIPQETYTAPGTVMRVLDLIITHTEEEIA